MGKITVPDGVHDDPMWWRRIRRIEEVCVDDGDVKDALIYPAPRRDIAAACAGEQN